MSIGASSLSLAASALYLIVVLAAFRAAATARRKRQRRAHLRNWLLLAILFVSLALSRMFELEEVLRLQLRDWLRASDGYGDRRFLQGILAAIAVSLLALGGFAWFHKASRALRGRRNLAVGIAIAAGVAMVLLVLVRLLSLHMFDTLLYGPLKLNWFADLGLSLTVMAAALYYDRVVRSGR